MMQVEPVRPCHRLPLTPAPDHRPAGVDDRQRQGEHRCNQSKCDGDLGHAQDRDHPERNPQEVRSGVAHEDARRVEVEDQEAHAAARERGTHLHDLGLLKLPRGEHQDRGHDRDDAGGQPVDAVEEVDRVHHAHEPEQADRRHQQAELDDVPAREAEEADLDREHHRRDGGKAQLNGQLDHGPHGPAVVDRQQRHRQTRDDRHTRGEAVPREEDHQRGHETQVHGEAAEHRRRVRVRVAPTGLGDQAQSRREADGKRRHRCGHGQGHEQRPQARHQVRGQAGQCLVAEEVSQMRRGSGTCGTARASARAPSRASRGRRCVPPGLRCSPRSRPSPPRACRASSPEACPLGPRSG